VRFPPATRPIYADWEHGDFSKAEWAHPDIEWVFADDPTEGRSTGLEEGAATFRRWGEQWEDFRIGADEFIELDADSVLVLARFGGRGRVSGIDVGQLPDQVAAVFYLRGGKVTRYVVYWDRDRALADLGLNE
jgi:ketosteroid isomerase-like protein